MKTRIQVKGELLEVSTCLWITAQIDISIKPTGPPSVFIPRLSQLAFLPAELFHVQSGQASGFDPVTHKDEWITVCFGLKKAVLDTDILQLQFPVLIPAISLVFHHRRGSYPVCFFLWSSMLLKTRIRGELRKLGPDRLLSISAVHVWYKWHHTGPPFLQLASFPDSRDTSWVNFLMTPSASSFLHELIPLQHSYKGFRRVVLVKI